MRISVFGLGYVGSVTGAALAKCGHSVTGVDLAEQKTDAFSKGEAPVVEEGLAECLRQGHSAGRIAATTSCEQAVNASDVSLVCVGTPSRPDGRTDISQVARVCNDIARAVKSKGTPHVVVLRSTIPPGTTAECTLAFQEILGPLPAHIAFNPEFLREGAGLRDFFDPPYTVVGTESELAEQTLRDMYSPVGGDFLAVPIAVAEMVKLVANAWHATKITFANEIGRISKHHQVDGRVVMELITKDLKLNVSPAYMRPGFAFGGSCLPKDVRALDAMGRREAISVPLLRALLDSNQRQIEDAAQLVLRHGIREIGLLGLAFKPGTDDLRESPAVALAEILVGKGCRLRIFDPSVVESQLFGANLAFVERHLPHLAELLADRDEIIDHSGLLVVTNGTDEYRDVIHAARPESPVVDLSGAFAEPPQGRPYEGIAW